MKHHKIIKILITILLALPFLACLALPIALSNGDFKQVARCFVCRLMAVITKDHNNRLC